MRRDKEHTVAKSSTANSIYHVDNLHFNIITSRIIHLLRYIYLTACTDAMLRVIRSDRYSLYYRTRQKGDNIFPVKDVYRIYTVKGQSYKTHVIIKTLDKQLAFMMLMPYDLD